MDILRFYLHIFVIYFLQVVAAQDEKVTFGKIIAVENPNAKKSIPREQMGRSQIFATRSVAFLKKDGDLFKIHRPGLLGKKGTISFESARLPGFFLRQKNKKVHLDNLKSRYITKDATFIESKGGVGESFKLFMHKDQFLCHEQGHGFSLFMLKDSPKRGPLNCAFNIVKVAPKSNIAAALPKEGKGKKNKPMSQGNKPSLPQQKNKKVNEGAVQAKMGKQTAAAKETRGGKPVSMYIKDKTTGQLFPEFKDLVNAIKQKKDPFPQQQDGSLIVVSGRAKGTANAKSPKLKAKQKETQKKQLNGKAIEQRKGGKILQQKGPIAINGAKKSFSMITPQPVHDLDGTSLQAKLIMQRLAKKQDLARQQAIAKQQGMVRHQALVKQQAKRKLQAFAKMQALAKQQRQQKSALKRFEFDNKIKYKLNLHPQHPRQENPSGRQLITSLYPQPVPQFHATNVVDQSIHYVPPSQWSTVVNTESRGWSHDAKDLLTNRQSSIMNAATATTNKFTTDNLLTKLHPELGLLHSALHDVNEVVSTDPNIHHMEVQQSNSIHQIRPAEVQMTTVPHETAIHAGLISEDVSDPIANVQHVNLPNAVPIHDNSRPIHLGHSAPLVVALPHPSVITSNAVAASELVHSDPDITLEEAFHKLEPMPSHPIEIASEPMHHSEALNHDGSHPDRAFHMRTHYVAGNPVDMSDEERNTLKEVHVVHHNHHLVHAADEEEKQKFVSTLIDSVSDLCISLLFVNNLGDRYRLVSTLNPHGYRPKGQKFSLKTIFKEPKKRKVMSFKAYDEEDSQRIVLLNGHKELNIFPVSCTNDPVQVVVDSNMNKLSLVTGSKKNEVLDQKREVGSCIEAKGGTSSLGACCVFPFTFKGQTHNNCLSFEDGIHRTWCSLTPNFDKERRWGMCTMPDLSTFKVHTEEEQNNDNNCPPSCSNECGKNCPISCCTDSSSSTLLH